MFAGMLRLIHAFAAIILPLPIVVSPPKIVAFA
ncbi:hypothetical protein CGSMWGv00703C2mash_02206 [Gardnerella pickettii 00703C2mash]|nr:hypothetical protein CGSMWGv00703C2mash_02206 [Gardnerella pickettii 00703C2mash]